MSLKNSKLESLTKIKAKGFEPKRPPTKAPRGGDIGRLIDCEIAEGFTLANLGHYPPNIPFPVGFACRYAWKIFKLWIKDY